MNMFKGKSAAIPYKYDQANLTTTQRSGLSSMSKSRTKRNSQEPTAVNQSGDKASNAQDERLPRPQLSHMNKSTTLPCHQRQTLCSDSNSNSWSCYTKLHNIITLKHVFQQWWRKISKSSRQGCEKTQFKHNATISKKFASSVDSEIYPQSKEAHTSKQYWE